jgi:hypothetical protein
MGDPIIDRLSIIVTKRWNTWNKIQQINYLKLLMAKRLLRQQ